MGIRVGRTQGMQIQKGLVPALLQKQGGFHGGAMGALADMTDAERTEWFERNDNYFV